MDIKRNRCTSRIGLEGENKWKTLIENASLKEKTN